MKQNEAKEPDISLAILILFVFANKIYEYSMNDNSYEINEKLLLNAELSVGTILGELMF